MFLGVNPLVRGVRQYLLATYKSQRGKKRVRRQGSLQPRLEALECRLTPATYTVNVTTDNGSFLIGQSTGATTGDLRFAIAQADAHPGSSIVFDLPASSTITVGTSLEPIFADVTIDGSTAVNLTLSGGGTSRIFFVTAGNVNIEGLTIANGLALGGAGSSGGMAAGGGGAGVGGGLLINSGTVALNNVIFTNDHARGGTGGAFGGAPSIGGGGGAGGVGGNAFAGGGGGGFLGFGGGGTGGATPGGGGGGGFTGLGGAGAGRTGTSGTAGGNGLSIGGGGGGSSGDNAAGGSGSPDGGGNGAGTGNGNRGGGGGGSSGFTGSSSGQNGVDNVGGTGGFGGGGGGGQSGGTGGDYGGGGGGVRSGGMGGDFGGGGGSATTGGMGGFGGGGGGGEFNAGEGGAFGGNGADFTVGDSSSGGGGAGLGGAIFLRAGSLTLSNTTFTGDTTSGGASGGGSATAGQGKGGALFIMDGATASYLGSPPTFSGNSASDAGSSTSNPQDNPDVFGALNQVVAATTIAYVDQTFSGTTPGTSPSTSPTGLTLQFGVNAFADIQSALDGLAANGTVVIFADSTPYAGFTVSIPVAAFDINQNPQNLSGSTLVAISSAVTLDQSVVFSQAAIQPGANPLAAAGLEFGGNIVTGGAPVSLTINGNANVDTCQAIGTTSNPLSFVLIASSGLVTLQQDVATSTTQEYDGPVNVENASLVTLTGTTVTFDSSVQSIVNHGSLTISGAAIFEGLVGGASVDLQNLQVTGATTVATNGVSVLGAEEFGDVTLNETTLFTGSGVTFDGKIDSGAGGPFGLQLALGSGSVTFSGPVGTVGPLGPVHVNNTGSININGGSIDALSQLYDGNVALGSASTLLTGVVVINRNLTLGATDTSATSTLQITGDLTFAETSTLTSTFAGTGPTQFGHITVSDTTAFNGSTLALNYSAFTPAALDSFDLVSNGTPRTSQFGNVPSSGEVTLGGVLYQVTYTGNGGTDFILTAVAQLLTIITPTHIAVGNFTATLGGDVTGDGGSPILERGVLFAKTSAHLNLMLGVTGVTEVDDPAMTIGVFADKVNGLTPGTGYSFVAFATNADGTVYTGVSTFTTTQTPATGIFGPTNGSPGQTLTFTLLASDPVSGTQSSTFTFHIKWGDGTTSIANTRSGATTTHLYANTGVYTIQITATDSHSNVLPVGTWTVTISRAVPGVNNNALKSKGGVSTSKSTAIGDDAMGIDVLFAENNQDWFIAFAADLIVKKNDKLMF